MNTIFDVLNDKFEVEAVRFEDYLTSGKCENFADYRHVCGLIRGLRIAQNETTDLLRQQMDEEND